MSKSNGRKADEKVYNFPLLVRHHRGRWLQHCCGADVVAGMMRITLGIDPGQTGAIAVLFDGEPVQIFDMPVSARKTTGQEVSASALVIELRAILKRAEGAHVFAALEQVGAMPGNGGTSMFRFGEGFGIVKGVLAALGIGYTLITPPRWKKWAGLIGADKDASRTLCIQRYPSTAQWLTRKKDNGRADAVLLARFAWESEQHASPSPSTNYEPSMGVTI